MNRSTKVLLIAEVIICFGVLAPLLVIGAAMVPLQIDALLEEPLLWEAPLYLIGQVACGICGLGSLTFVLVKLLGARSAIRHPTLVWVGVLLGVLPILEMLIRGSSGWKIFAAIPLAATVHVTFLSGRLLFPSVKRGLADLGIAALLVLPLPLLFTLPLFEISEQELLARRQAWAERKPARYEFTVQGSGWAHPEVLYPKRVVVSGSEVESAVYLWPVGRHQQGDRAPVDAVWTMDATFDALLAARHQGWSVRVRFDDRWGFVERAFLDTDKPNSQWDLDIKEFRSLDAVK